MLSMAFLLIVPVYCSKILSFQCNGSFACSPISPLMHLSRNDCNISAKCLAHTHITIAQNACRCNLPICLALEISINQIQHDLHRPIVLDSCPLSMFTLEEYSWWLKLNSFDNRRSASILDAMSFLGGTALIGSASPQVHQTTQGPLGATLITIIGFSQKYLMSNRKSLKVGPVHVVFHVLSPNATASLIMSNLWKSCGASYEPLWDVSFDPPHAVMTRVMMLRLNLLPYVLAKKKVSPNEKVQETWQGNNGCLLDTHVAPSCKRAYRQKQPDFRLRCLIVSAPDLSDKTATQCLCTQHRWYPRSPNKCVGSKAHRQTLFRDSLGL